MPEIMESFCHGLSAVCFERQVLVIFNARVAMDDAVKLTSVIRSV